MDKRLSNFSVVLYISTIIKPFTNISFNCLTETGIRTGIGVGVGVGGCWGDHVVSPLDATKCHTLDIKFSSLLFVVPPIPPSTSCYYNPSIIVQTAHFWLFDMGDHRITANSAHIMQWLKN